MNFLQEIHSDIDWRYSELSILRTLPFRYSMSELHNEFLIRYSVPIIYSLWEGFVKNIFEIYVRELNSLNLKYDELNINVLTHAFSTHDNLNLRNSRTTYKAQKDYVQYLTETIGSPFRIYPKLITNSNVNFEVINDILFAFNLEKLPNRVFKRKIDKLLRFRNSVSHGDNSIPVSAKDIEEFCETINNLMAEVYNRIDDGFSKETFRK